MKSHWRWACSNPRAGQVVTDKVFIATTLLANMYNVYEGMYDEYFQAHIDCLELSEDEKAEVIELLYLSTNTIYSKRDFDKMLPKYLHTLNKNTTPL